MTGYVLSILERSWVALQDVAAEKGSKQVTERDFQRAVECVSGAHSGRIVLESWPVDVILPTKTGLELKWCKSGDTLANCAWDIAKLATAIAEGKLERGLVAAGSPAAHWATRPPGVDLFTAAEHDSAELVRQYESWWRFWCKDVKTRPIRLPSSIRVADERRVAAQLDGTTFELRVTSIEVIDASWRAHVCPHRWTAERCPPRPWDPEGWGGLEPTPD